MPVCFVGDSLIARLPRPVHTEPTAVDVGDLGTLNGPPRVVAGSRIRVGIKIQGWSPEAAHPYPGFDVASLTVVAVSDDPLVARALRPPR